MLCGMKDNSTCACRHNSHQPANGLSIFNKDSDCCKEGVAELANKNLLSMVKIELPLKISSFTPALLSAGSGFISEYKNNFIYTPGTEHVPKSDIPIVTSSLLI